MTGPLGHLGRYPAAIMLRALLKLFETERKDDGEPVVIAWAGATEISLTALAGEAEQLQTIFDLIPSVKVLNSELHIYSDQEEYIKIWYENPNYLLSYLSKEKYLQLPYQPSSCLVLQYYYYEKDSRPKGNPNFHRSGLDPNIAEHLWDRVIWRLLKLFNGILIIDDEGITDSNDTKIIDWT